MPFPLSPLASLDLGLTGDSVFAALQPFVTRDTERFAVEMKLRRKRLLKRLRKRAKRGWLGRSTDTAREEYDTAWSAGHDRYDINRGEQSFTPWVWKGEKILVDAAGSARFRNLMLGAVIAKLAPRRVLEVGCGDGINLMLLAGTFPQVRYTGLELTATGHAAAKAVQAGEALPENIRSYAPLPQHDATAFKRIDFVQGDACRMPFADGEFDLVFTVLALEQMEQVRATALRDIARVSRDALLNLEPFRDVNTGGLRRLNVMSRDYFRGSIAEMANYGFRPQWATDDFPQEVFLGSALVLSRKNAASSSSARPPDGPR